MTGASKKENDSLINFLSAKTKPTIQAHAHQYITFTDAESLLRQESSETIFFITLVIIFTRSSTNH